MGSVPTCHDQCFPGITERLGVKPPKTKALTGQRTPEATLEVDSLHVIQFT
jgi:hypothetical protein